MQLRYELKIKKICLLIYNGVELKNGMRYKKKFRKTLF